MRRSRQARLERALVAGRNRRRPWRLAVLYGYGARLREQAGERDAACFLATQAYVCALEAGAGALAQQLHAYLKRHAREA